jgi:hypothetical protein
MIDIYYVQRGYPIPRKSSRSLGKYYISTPFAGSWTHFGSIRASPVLSHFAGPIRSILDTYASTSFLRMLEDLKHPLLQLWIRVQGHGVFSIGAIFGLVVLYTARYFASPYRKLPQGPRGYPIIGNLIEIRAGQWFMFSSGKRNTVSSFFILFCPISLSHI